MPQLIAAAKIIITAVVGRMNCNYPLLYKG